MTSLITGTWTLISSSAEIITGARRMTLRIHRMLQPGLLELSEGDRRRLVALQKRVDCLVHPLNFLLLWSKQRDSCVQQVVLSAQDLLSDVCDFVDKYFPQDTGGPIVPGSSAKASAPGGNGIDSEQLEYYLRELEFACSSVSMAVSIARTTEATSVQQQLLPLAASTALPGPLDGAGGAASSQASGENGTGSISLSALLRASRRIQDMSGRSGDLCTCAGRLYARAVGSRSGAVMVPPDAGGSKPSADRSGDGDAPGWVQMLSLATLKVVASADSRVRRRRYSMSVESRLPLSQREGQPSPTDECGMAAAGTGCADEPSPGARGLNTSGPHSFPIEAALDARLVTTGLLALPAEPSRCDLGVDELALVWYAPSSVASGSGGLRSGGGGSQICEESGGELVELLPEASMAAPETAPRPLWDRARAASPRAAPRSAEGAGPAALAGGSWFAFVFNGRRGPGEPRGESDVPLTPLDALYLARLCAYDDGQHQLFLHGDGGAQKSGADDSACPPHLTSSDEVLAALLQQTEVTAAPTSTNAMAAPSDAKGSA